MSGFLPNGQPAYNGQHMMGYQLNGSVNGSMPGSMNPPLAGINGQLNPLDNHMSSSMSGLGNQMGGALGGPMPGANMGMGNMNGLGGLGNINAGMNNMDGLGLGGSDGTQYQQPAQRPQLSYQQPTFPPQYASPNLLNTQLGNQLPQPHQHRQPAHHHALHQPHHQPHHQQNQPQQRQPMPQPHQRFSSPQQGGMPFQAQRSQSTSSNNGIGGYPSFSQASPHNLLPTTSPTLANLSAPTGMSMPLAGAASTVAPMHTPSPTLNHLGSPMQFMPQQPLQSQHHHQHQPAQQQHQPQRYSQPQNTVLPQMSISSFTNSSPGVTHQQLPQHQLQHQNSQHHASQHLQRQHSSQSMSQQPVQPAIHQPPASNAMEQPIAKPHSQPHSEHVSPQQQNTQPLEIQKQPTSHSSFPETINDDLYPSITVSQQQTTTAKPPKALKPTKLKQAQQAKKPISLAPEPSPPGMDAPIQPPPKPASNKAAKKQMNSSFTPSPIPGHRSLQNSPRVSPKGGIQKPAKTNASTYASTAAAKAARQKSVGGVVTGHHGLPRRSAVETASILVCVADNCFTRAQTMAPALAKSRDEQGLREYFKLMSTGLGTLDNALRVHRFPPRVEVKMKIRYAAILSSETENLMEAETTLQSAVTTCEKHRLTDLKLYVQFLFMKVLFRRKPKAALISIQNHINDCMDRRHTHWVYAFRFLKASFHMQSGNPVENAAIENLNAITTLAERLGDHAVYVLASLLHALALFRTAEPDVLERIQTCMAAASKYQLDQSVHIPQLDVLWLFLDLGCSLSSKEKALTEKLHTLQVRMEELKDSPQWDTRSSGSDRALIGELLKLPLGKDANNPNGHTISDDTNDVILPGGDCDYLVFSSFSKVTAFILGFAYSGLTLAPKQQANDHTSFDYWNESLRLISQSAKSNAPTFLNDAINESRWRANTSAYLLVLIGLNAATHCKWDKVNECIRELEAPVAEARDGPLDVLALYLRGVLKQGQGELNDALSIFEDSRLALSSSDVELSASANGSSGPASAAAASAAAWSASNNEGLLRQEVTLLAAMNRLLIMQLIRLRDEPKINLLVEELQAVCSTHSNPEIKTAFSLVMAAITTNPPLSMHDIKSHIQQGLNGSTVSSNAQCLNIALNTMRYRLFDNVVGEQALKSAKAGSAQARKSGNILWMSVADGMLAETYDVAGQPQQASISREAGIQYANESWQRTQL